MQLLIRWFQKTRANFAFLRLVAVFYTGPAVHTVVWELGICLVEVTEGGGVKDPSFERRGAMQEVQQEGVVGMVVTGHGGHGGQDGQACGYNGHSGGQGGGQGSSIVPGQWQWQERLSWLYQACDSLIFAT